jgi:hypothetical protein
MYGEKHDSQVFQKLKSKFYLKEDNILPNT